MTCSIPFTKMHGLGNDYIYVWAPLLPADADPSALSKRWSRPHTGIGSDGLILVGPASDGEADFAMRIFNADGSEAAMCGNGARCAGRYLHEKKLTVRTDIRLQTPAGIRTLHLHPEPDTGAVTNVTVEMGKASAIRVDETTLQSLVEPWGYAEAMAVNMGNPHLVIFVGDALSVPVAEIGQELEHSVLFPTGVNVEFAEVIDRRHILMRVWERGSGITQACGTGACATAVACHWAGLTEAMNQQVTMDGGTLAVSYDPLTSHVTMTGSAVTVFEGEIEV